MTEKHDKDYCDRVFDVGPEHWEFFWTNSPISHRLGVWEEKNTGSLEENETDSDNKIKKFNRRCEMRKKLKIRYSGAYGRIAKKYHDAYMYSSELCSMQSKKEVYMDLRGYLWKKRMKLSGKSTMITGKEADDKMKKCFGDKKSNDTPGSSKTWIRHLIKRMKRFLCERFH